MRVLFWQEPFWPQVGGMAVAADVLLRELAGRGCTVAVVTGTGDAAAPPSGHEEGVKELHGAALSRFPFWQVLSGGDLDRVAALQQGVAALKRRFAADVVHLGGIGPSMILHWQSARHVPAPTLVTLHSSNTLSGAENTLVRRTLEDADWVVGCSRAILDEARQALPSIRARSSVIYNGIRRPAAPPAPPPASPSLLCVGRLEAHKGFEHAIAALAILRRQFPDLRLVIAGDGPERPDLERQAAALGAGSAVRFLGLVPHDQIPTVMNAATLVLAPSRRESFGLVAIEAALMHRPVVAARTGGLPEVVLHRETGVLVDEPDGAGLAAAVGDLLAHPETLAQMGVAAGRRAAQQFGAVQHADAYEQLYRRLAAERRLSPCGGAGR